MPSIATETFPFPQARRLRGRVYFSRRQIEIWKASVIRGRAVDESEFAHVIEEFVPASVVAKECGVSRRTIGRRIKEAMEAA